MIKLITPPGMLFTTALLVIYGTYAVLIGSTEDSLPLLIGGGVAALATYGTAMVRPWSQYLVYLMTAGFSASSDYRSIRRSRQDSSNFSSGRRSRWPNPWGRRW